MNFYNSVSMDQLLESVWCCDFWSAIHALMFAIAGQTRPNMTLIKTL